MRKPKNKKRLSSEEEDEIIGGMNQRSKSNEFNLNNLNINFKCKTENQKKFVNLIKEKEIIIGAGFSGCGKTFLAAAQALKLLKSEPHFKKIMLVKSVTDLKGEEVGFLKGELKDKMQPYMESFKDNFVKLIGPVFANKLQELGLIEVQPLAFIRGRSIDNTVIIVDEAQNLSYDVMKAVLTRIGENSKIIITGDVKQIDLKQKKESCLLWLTEKFEGNPHFGVVKFERTDQVRNPIINIIEDMFDELDNK